MLQSVGDCHWWGITWNFAMSQHWSRRKNNLQNYIFILLSCTSHLKTRVLVFFKGIFGNRWCLFLNPAHLTIFFRNVIYISTYPGFLSKINLTILLLPRPLLEPLPWLPLLPFAPVQQELSATSNKDNNFPTKKLELLKFMAKRNTKKHIDLVSWIEVGEM